MRILIVEDERLLCDGIAEDLELEKYTVERCYDGNSAYRLLLEERFELLILDLNLPGWMAWIFCGPSGRNARKYGF